MAEAKTELPPRGAVPVEHTWDAASVFASGEAWEAAFQEAGASLPGLSRFHGRLGDGPDALLDWLKTAEALRAKVEKLFVYASMFHTVDVGDSQAAARFHRASGLHARALAATAFARPEMLAIGAATLQEWMRRQPELAPYAYFFAQLERQRPHTRSAEVEELLGQVSEPFATAARIHGILSDADLAFAPATDSAGNAHEVAQSTISALITAPDRALRRAAFENYADAYLAHRSAMANCLAAGVQRDVFQARARRYGSCLEAALQPHNLPTSVFHNLIATFRRHLPTWHRYWNLRRRALGYDRLHVYDIKAPLTEAKPTVSYPEAVDWIAAGMEPLGAEYVRSLRRGLLEERWVDIYPNRGKRMGAFSSGRQGTHPFIFMSYNDDIFSMSTLAHEIGHSMHSYHTWLAQPPAYARYSLFVAEVASNFNQAMVRAHLLATRRDAAFQIAVIEEAMANFHRYFFVMPTLARFELEIHERAERGEALTADSLMALMTDLFREGYGEEVVNDADRIGITWAQFPTHLYSNFYVYQYATGISGAHALAQGVLDGGAEAAERYRSFLKAGGSLDPLDALKLAGVDLSTPEPVERTFAVLGSYVDRLASLLDAAGQ